MRKKDKQLYNDPTFRLDNMVIHITDFQDASNRSFTDILNKCRRLVLKNERVERKMWELDAYLLKKYDDLAEQIIELNNKAKFMDIFNV